VRRFSALYEAIDQTTSTNAKVAALAAYFRDAPPADAAWAIFFLTGRRLKRVVASAALREWAQELTHLPEWLFHECYSAAGDFAELIALALDAVPPGPPEPELSLAAWVEDRLVPLQTMEVAGQRAMVTKWWLGLPRAERFLLNKLLTGEFRVGVAHTLVVRALAAAASSEPTRIAARLMGDLDALRGVVLRCGVRRRGRSRPVAALPVLSCITAGGTAGCSRRSEGLARRMEVGRHPRTAHPARW